jgi:hypothetical protein
MPQNVNEISSNFLLKLLSDKSASCEESWAEKEARSCCGTALTDMSRKSETGGRA